jgi:glycosyltransferase involved in cell wall biosynthesis
MKKNYSHMLNTRLSALIITYNEEANIFRTLSAIKWISDILVIDSGSSDRTIQIINQFSNTRLIYRQFDSFAKQCNFGLEQLSSEWVLSLDADYVLSSQLSKEILGLFTASNDIDLYYQAYRIAFDYCISGKAIRSGLLPPRTCLYERLKAHYIDIGHGHKIVVNGRVGSLKHKILHDDRKPFGKWLNNQQRYQRIEARMLATKSSNDLPVQDLIRKHTFLAPFLAFFMCIILRRGFLDGKEGIVYAFHRLIAESLLYVYMHGEKEEL